MLSVFFSEKVVPLLFKLCHFHDYCCVVLFPQVITRSYNVTLYPWKLEHKSTVGARAIIMVMEVKEVIQGQQNLS